MPKKPSRWLAGRRAPAARSLAGDGAGAFSPGLARPTLSGPAIDERSALSIPAVWSAVNCYVNTIGALDLYVAERDARGGRRPAVDHPAYDLIRSRPNASSTSMRFRQAWVGHALTFGNGYAEIEWDARGRRAVALHLMDPRTTRPDRDHLGRVVYRQGSGDGPAIPADSVLHLAMFGWDGVKGYSPVTIARESLGIPAAQRDYQAGLYGNSAQAGGHLEIPGKMPATAKATLLDEWQRRHQGPQNAGLTGILDNGAKWVQTNFSPQDAELILGCHFSVAEVARIFNLPQHKLNLLDHATFSNVEEMNIDFYQSSILPWLVAIEQEMDAKLFGPIERRSYFVRHDVFSLLRGNMASQTAQDSADIASGVRSLNEVRIGRGLNPIEDPGADKHWVPTNNLTALEDMGKSAPAPAAQGDPDQADAQDPTRKAPAPAPTPAAPAAARSASPEDLVDRAIESLAGAARP